MARLVARRGDLPDLSPVVPGSNGDGVGDLAASPAAALRRRSRGRRGLAVADLHLADGRHGLRHLRTIPRSTRSSARSPTSTRWWRGRTGSGSRSSSTRYFRILRSAPLVPGEPAEPRQPQGRLVRLGGPRARRHAAEQLAVDLRRRRLGVGAAAPPVLPAQLPGRAARPQLPQSRGAGRAARRQCASGSSAASTASASTPSTTTSTTSAARQPGRAGRKENRPSGTPTTCRTIATPRTSRRTSTSSNGCGSWSTNTRPARWSARSARGTTRSGSWPTTPPAAAAQMLFLRHAGRPIQRRAFPRPDRGVLCRGARRLAVLELLQPRRRAARHPLGETRQRPGAAGPARRSAAPVARGSICIYQGEELGLPETELEYPELTDPQGMRFWPENKGRDGCRTPMAWDAAEASSGFSPAALAADQGAAGGERGRRTGRPARLGPRLLPRVCFEAPPRHP